MSTNRTSFIVIFTSLFALCLTAKLEASLDQVRADLASKDHPQRICVDRIQAIVFSENMFCVPESHLDRVGLDGQKRTLDDIIIEQLICDDSKMYSNKTDDDEVDKYIQKLQRERDLSIDQIKEMFAGAGYTYEEGKKELGKLQTVNQMIDFRIRSRLIVPEREITKYYNEHITELRIPAQYSIERIFIPALDDPQAQEKYAQAIAHGKAKLDGDIKWSDSFWVAENELAEDKKFISTMAVHSISKPIRIEDGFELFRLTDKKAAQERTLKDPELLEEITGILRGPRFEALFNEYKQSLFDKVAIIYL